jgi:hypothetical protein
MQALLTFFSSVVDRGREPSQWSEAEFQPVEARPIPAARKGELHAARTEMACLLRDCPSADTAQILGRLYKAESAYALWLLRVDVFHLVAQSHGEQEARQRVNRLLPYFRGKVPGAVRPV